MGLQERATEAARASAAAEERKMQAQRAEGEQAAAREAEIARGLLARALDTPATDVEVVERPRVNISTHRWGLAGGTWLRAEGLLFYVSVPTLRFSDDPPSRDAYVARPCSEAGCKDLAKYRIVSSDGWGMALARLGDALQRPPLCSAHTPGSRESLGL